MYFATINAKGQVTIPAEIRKKLHLQAGDVLMFEVVGKKLMFTKQKNDITKAFGMYRVNRKISLKVIHKATRR